MNVLSLIPGFRSAISGFSKLSDYGYLEDDLLLSKLITIQADEIPKLQSRITPLAWEKLTAACPELIAIFHIMHNSESCSQDATTILLPFMPLYQVKWKAGDAIAIENLEKFFQHVAQNFQNTLHHLHLQTCISPDMEHFEYFFKSLQARKNLDTLSLCLKSYKSGDVEMYSQAIRDVMTRCPVSCDVTLKDQAVKFQPDWSQLPYDILLHVFRYLSNSDKFHAALTCKSWLRPLSVPSLWQSGDFVFDSKSDEKAITFINITGKSIRHIHAECKEVKTVNMDLECRPSSSEKMYLFLATILNSDNHQLLTFRLKNLNNLEVYYGEERSKSLSEVATLLTKVLKVQRQLRVLDLSNSQNSVKSFLDVSLTVYEGIKLLSAAAEHCATTIQKLAIARLICLKNNNRNNLSQIPGFRSAISGFNKLSELDLSHSYINDDLLLSLARTTTSLKLITIRADELRNVEHGTTAAWEHLTAACPELKAVFHIKHKSESYFQDATKILTPSIPLYQVKWKAGAAIAIENLQKFFQHVADHFKNTLHHLYLQTGVRPDMEHFEHFFKSLQACKNLDTLSLCLKSYKSDDVEMYMQAIKDVMTRCPVSCDVTLNGQIVKIPLQRRITIMADDKHHLEHLPLPPEIYLEPIVKLPLFEIKTMEEDEEVLLNLTAKLFRYAHDAEPKEWKERGTGKCKILKHKKNGLIRILMRREKTLKICANHYIYPSMELKPNCGSDRAWVWSTTGDFADEESKEEVLAIRFANAENAQKFKTVFDESSEEMKKVLNKKSVIENGDTNAEIKDEEKEKVNDGTAELAGQLKDLNVSKHTEEGSTE
ncbi:uncharacterized protein LOC131938875 [Physella acuta]|uniref:uncharacterized protein LOC131938875 n=1 Tax=Physella acuta TaxID=109671 RepID=UPI0027DCCCBC|nr:uncharacterized protein LOC131938875 [Physella acuta]